MNDLNTVALLGRLTRDPELRFAAGGTAVASFSIAANHPYQDKSGQWKDEVAFVPCAAFGRPAEQLRQKHKGEPLLVTGRLRTEAWQKDGFNHSRLVLVVETLHFVLGPSKADGTLDSKDNLPDTRETQKSVPF